MTKRLKIKIAAQALLISLEGPLQDLEAAQYHLRTVILNDGSDADIKLAKFWAYQALLKLTELANTEQ